MVWLFAPELGEFYGRFASNKMVPLWFWHHPNPWRICTKKSSLRINLPWKLALRGEVRETLLKKYKSSNLASLKYCFYVVVHHDTSNGYWNERWKELRILLRKVRVTFLGITDFLRLCERFREQSWQIKTGHELQHYILGWAHQHTIWIFKKGHLRLHTF